MDSKEAFDKWRASKCPLSVNDAWHDGTIWDFIWGLAWEAFQEGEKNAYKNVASRDDDDDRNSLMKLAEGGGTLDMPGLMEWDAVLLYKHKAFAQIRSEKIDTLLAHCYSEACEFAQKTAEAVMKQKFPNDDMLQIESWTVKVRPARK